MNLKKTFINIVEGVSLIWFALTFIIVILIFAGIYYSLVPGDNGIVYCTDCDVEVSIWDALYFSAVTISSLGIGDIKPLGLSKFFAVLEVLIGLGLMGIIIAKISSGRLSYHVKRLFGSDAQKRLDVISISFETLQNRIIKVTGEVGLALQTTPGDSEEKSEIEEEKIQQDLKTKFNQIVEELRKLSKSFRDYINYEFKHGDFFADMPLDAIAKAGEEINEVFWELSQMLIILTPAVRGEYLNQQNRKKITELIRFHEEVWNSVISDSKDENLKNTFLTVQSSCERVAENFVPTPEDVNLPDQLPEPSDDPQGIN